MHAQTWLRAYLISHSNTLLNYTTLILALMALINKLEKLVSLYE